MSQLHQLYKAVGNELFSRKVCEIAPYFATIDPQFVDLRPGYSKVTMPNTREVHNHLGTVHAIAMCNLAEIAAGIMTDVSIPDTCRWIPIGMRVKYLAKAKTALTGIADGRKIDWNKTGEIEVPVSITDTDGVEVCTVFITVKVSLKNL
jgi:acyl-coenzyme A thioesterase PaaI-like protein